MREFSEKRARVGEGRERKAQLFPELKKQKLFFPSRVWCGGGEIGEMRHRPDELEKAAPES